MPTDPPASIDPDTWEAAVEAAWNEMAYTDHDLDATADGLRAALAVLGSGETAREYRRRRKFPDMWMSALPQEAEEFRIVLRGPWTPVNEGSGTDG